MTFAGEKFDATLSFAVSNEAPEETSTGTQPLPTDTDEPAREIAQVEAAEGDASAARKTPEAVGENAMEAGEYSRSSGAELPPPTVGEIGESAVATVKHTVEKAKNKVEGQPVIFDKLRGAQAVISVAQLSSKPSAT